MRFKGALEARAKEIELLKRQLQQSEKERSIFI
jgi:hypothetical protein